ncbi:LytR C-terminal domain-containing protein [Thermasporomyces composti]|jgi:hypothetical protein|uniref:LytR cell envelope-related transcriptional attenuator n=1 Tax=Thermasporomyces composti TaxID=696763 RepID=A0A3D9VHL3_THECX|nr:LytR C-terminal domain-containing protein [Thermasporomyces composti]REF36791.1 LytR cell envelope-related transcriptional attenuator [Thermasporomyces composti]
MEPSGVRSYPYRRRRRIRGPITLLVLMGILVGAAWYGYDTVIVGEPKPEPTVVCATPSPNQKQYISAQTFVVNVYNASKISGLAERTANALRERGFTIGKIGNDPYGVDPKYAEIRGRDRNAPEVLLVSEHFSGEVRRGDDRTDTTVDIILGPKFYGLMSKAPAAMDVTTPIGVCVTTTPTPNVAAYR